MPEHTSKQHKPGRGKGDVKVRDMKPTKDAKGGGPFKPASGGAIGSSNTLPVPPTQTNN